MRFPTMGNTSPRVFSIPALNGGLNTTDAPERIGDNQLSDCCNMWFSDGALRVRPGVRIEAGSYPDMVLTPNVFIIGDGSCGVVKAAVAGESVGAFFLLDTAAGTFSRVTCTGSPAYRTDGAFAEDGNDTVLFFDAAGAVWRISPDDGTAQLLTETDFYTPLFLINAKPDNSGSDTSAYVVNEGLNTLSSAFRSLWTTDGEGISFKFPVELDGTKEIVVRYTHTTGTVYTFTIGSSGTSNAVSGIESVPVWFKRGDNSLWVENTGGATVALPSAGFNGNVEIMAHRVMPDEAAEAFCCSFSTWYGVDTVGSVGGDMLFLGGSSRERNRVVYSFPGEPLYFPDNNQFALGDAGQPVTAFGKQQSYLIVFKSRSMYAVSGQSVTIDAEEFAAGQSIDTSSVVAFSSLLLSPAVGCDLGRTVALCGNRLAWATSERRVYTLSSLSNLSDRSVRVISQPIERELATADISEASAAVFNNAYHLALGTQVFLFDFSDSGFYHNSGYASARKAADKIAWYRFDVAVPFSKSTRAPDSQTARLLSGGAVLYEMRYDNVIGSGRCLIFARLDGATDSCVTAGLTTNGFFPITVTGRPVDASFATKAYDFGAPGRLKNVSELTLLLSREGETVRVGYQTDRGGHEDPFSPRLGTSVFAFTPCRFTPRENRVRVFSVSATIEGSAAVASVEMTYTLLGGVR